MSSQGIAYIEDYTLLYHAEKGPELVTETK